MKIKVDSDKLRVMRKENCWSQEQVAEKAGVSLRTVQRIENGSMASHDSVVSLANVFDVKVNYLMLDEDELSDDATHIKMAKDMMALQMSFGIHLISFIVGVASMILIDFVGNPGSWWFIWPTVIWAIGLMAHAGAVVLVGYVQKMSRRMRELELAGSGSGQLV